MAGKESVAPASGKPGPRLKLHIRIAYMGEGPPGPQMRERCERIEATLVEENAGTIAPGAMGNGAVDIYVMTRHVDKTRAVAWTVINDLGLAGRSTVCVVDGKVEG